MSCLWSKMVPTFTTSAIVDAAPSNRTSSITHTTRTAALSMAVPPTFIAFELQWLIGPLVRWLLPPSPAAVRLCHLSVLRKMQCLVCSGKGERLSDSASTLALLADMACEPAKMEHYERRSGRTQHCKMHQTHRTHTHTHSHTLSLPLFLSLSLSYRGLCRSSGTLGTRELFTKFLAAAPAAEVTCSPLRRSVATPDPLSCSSAVAPQTCLPRVLFSSLVRTRDQEVGVCATAQISMRSL
jgi:hypothetical protein